MSSLIYSFVSQYSLNISIKTLNAYINYFINFLSSNASSSISYITFHSFFNYVLLFPLEYSTSLFIFIQTQMKKSFIEGLSLLYLSEMDSRIATIYKLCDFDNDGITCLLIKI